MQFLYSVDHKVNFSKLTKYEVEHYELFHYCVAKKNLVDYVDYFRKSNSIVDKNIAEKIYANNRVLYNFIKDETEFLKNISAENFVELFEKYKDYTDWSNSHIHSYRKLKNEMLMQKFDLCMN